MRKAYTRGEVTLDEIINNTTKTKDCLEWNRAVARNGYGQIRRAGRLVTVTRLVMHLARGFDYMTDKRLVLHRCDNPRCVNIKHLYLGTTAVNIRDKVRRNRHVYGQRAWKAVLTDVDVRRIFKLYKNGMKQRALARRFNVSPAAIWNILNRRTWKHVKI